jgi:hypothetical protein
MPRAEEAKLLCLRRVPCRITLCVNGQDSKAEIFDVFLCHNSEDTPAVREIAQMLVKEGIKPWLDEDEIRPGTSWQIAPDSKTESIKSAAVFCG